MKNHLLGLSLANNILLKESSVADALHKCVAILGESQGVDRCYILKSKEKTIHFFFEWWNTGIGSVLDKPHLVKEIYDEISKMYSGLFNDEPIHGIVNECNSPSFYTIMNSRNVKSYLFTPIFSNSEFWGLLAYEDCEIEKKWIIEEVQSLHLFAKNVGIRINQDRILSELNTKLESFNFYMEDSQYGMWELNLLTFKVKFSDHWAGMLGYTIDEFEHTYDFWKKNVHLDDILRVEKEFHDYISNYSDTYEGVFRMKHKKGNYVWLKYNGLIKRDLIGNPIKIIGRHIDINEIKEEEIQLRLAENKFRCITENTSDIIFQHTVDGSFVYVSSSSKEILGYEPEEMINKKAFDFIHPDDFTILKRANKEFIKTANNKPITYRFRKKNSTYVWLETISRNIFNHENLVIGVQTSSRDVSEKIKSAQKIKMVLASQKEYNDKKFKFVSMASHQFKTPLAVIYSNAELINMKINHLEKKIIDSIEFSTDRIKNEVDRMNELMNNILVFGQYEAKKIKKDIKPIDFDAFIKTLIDTYFSNDVHKRKIHVEIIGKKQIFFTDESLITHVLTNLICNAFKYSIGKSDPSLIVTYLESEIEILVIDSGIGIPENEIQYLFTSFFRASNTSAISGSGLGLVIVKKFTEFLNGKIEVKTKEGFGTKIKLIFPYEQK